MVDAIGLERLEKICNSNFATSINLCLSLSLVCGRDVFTEAREALHKVTTLQYSCSEGVFNNFVKDYANATVAVFRRYGETLEKPTRRARHTESRTTFFKKIKLILDELHLVVPKIVPGTDEPFLTHYNACLTQLDADISLSKSRLAKAKARDGAPRPARSRIRASSSRLPPPPPPEPGFGPRLVLRDPWAAEFRPPSPAEAGPPPDQFNYLGGHPETQLSPHPAPPVMPPPDQFNYGASYPGPRPHPHGAPSSESPLHQLLKSREHVNALDAFTTPQESRAALDKARNSLTDMLSVSGNSTSPALRLSMLLYAREAHSFAVGAFDPKTSPTLEYASAVYPGMYHMASALKLIRATPELTGEHKKIAEEFAKDMHIGAMKIYAVALGMPDAPQRRDLPTPSELAGEQWKQWEPQGHEYQQHQGQRR